MESSNPADLLNFSELKSTVGSLIPLEKGGVLALEANRALLLPNRYISWGFPDRSIRIGVVDSDRVILISDSVFKDMKTRL